MRTIGYIKSIFGLAGTVQEQKIRQYCDRYSISLDGIYWEDKDNHARRELLSEMAIGEIGVILVDTELRLYRTRKEQQELMLLCKRSGVQIIEVSQPREPLPSVAIYHSTINPGRTKVVLDEIDRLYIAASRLNWDAALFLDLSNKSRQQYVALSKEPGVTNIVVNRLATINRKTGAISQWLKNATLITLNEGVFSLVPDENKVKQKQKLALYDCIRTQHDMETKELRERKLQLFIEKRTGCDTCKKYIDIYQGKQEWNKLCRDKEKFELIVVDCMGRLAEETRYFGKRIREIAPIPIYCLQEGGLLVWKEN